jgi:short-subunit dehydrogenase
MKTALITGASGGIGEELAYIHASNGGDLVLVARTRSKLMEIKNKLEENYKIKVWIYEADLSLEESVQSLFNFTQHHQIKIDYLINNAGFGDYGYFHERDWKKQEEMINLNITALTHLCHLYSSEMIKNKFGKILNVASIASFQPGPLMSVYYASKAFVLSFSEALNNELNDFSITVTTLCPGPVKTGFQDAADLNESKLFSTLKPVSAKKVAKYGYDSMIKGRTVAIEGFLNKILVTSNRITPRFISTKIVRLLQNKKK